MSSATDWLEIKLETTDNHPVEALEEALFASGALSVTLNSKHDEIILIEPNPGDLPLWDGGVIVTGLYEKGQDTNQALAIIKSCLGSHRIPLLGAELLADRVWELEWCKHFKPLKFGQNLWVCPSNQNIPKNEISDKTQIITLDPGLAFGTGTHPTTAMVLGYLATHNYQNRQVIDYGCGSGVLGIAALKMGAKHCLMTDIDPQAITTTISNAKINQVALNITAVLADDVLPQQAELLIANILLEPLLALKDTFYNLCAPQATIILTGLLQEQVPQIIEKYQSKFTNFEETCDGDWSMLTACKL